MKIPEYLTKSHYLYPKFGKIIKKKRQIPNKYSKKITFSKSSKSLIAIFLEPHSDDIALSISGTLINLYKKGYEIKIVNIFSKTPFSTCPWQEFNLNENEYFQIRKLEDIAAFRKMLDCKLIFLNLKSSKFRGYSIFYQKPKLNDSAIRSIEKELIKLKQKFPRAMFFVPAGIGNHVDHILLRDLAIKCLNNLYLYEDYPYCANKKYYLRDIDKLRAIGSKKIVVKIDINLKICLMNLYNSQLKDDFKTIEKNAKLYFGKVSLKKGYHERYWSLKT